eukprot:3765821-Prymnesium_polylepis.1
MRVSLGGVLRVSHLKADALEVDALAGLSEARVGDFASDEANRPAEVGIADGRAERRLALGDADGGRDLLGEH